MVLCSKTKIMEKITFDQLPEMVALILEKLNRIEMLIGSGETGEQHLGKEMLTLDETASFMGVSKSMLYKMSSNRGIPIYKPTGKKLFFKREDILEFLTQNRVKSQKEIEQEAINYVIKNPLKLKG
jgi:excisionase family DNA binding protein